jgi:hypothetical protein
MLAVDPHPAHRNATRPGVQPFGSMLTTSRIPRAHRRQILRLSKRIVPAPESAELRRLQNSILTKMGQTVNRNPRLWYRNVEQSQGRYRNQQSVDGRRTLSAIRSEFVFRFFGLVRPLRGIFLPGFETFYSRRNSHPTFFKLYQGWNEAKMIMQAKMFSAMGVWTSLEGVEKVVISQEVVEGTPNGSRIRRDVIGLQRSGNGCERRNDQISGLPCPFG